MSPLTGDHWTAHLVRCVRAACLLEATARKPGNVHPGASFADLSYAHFQQAADVLGPPVARSRENGVGRTVLLAVESTQKVSPSNANLGIVLLVAPLAAVPAERSLTEGIGAVLTGLTITDAQYVYEAIRLARPGGLGRVDREDLSEMPTGTLLECMALAADRDLIARQYACEFADVLQFGVPCLAQSADFEQNWERVIIGLHLELLARSADSLIARKCGSGVAADASARARAILSCGWPDSEGSASQLQEFDRWLRADGNRRNPGATADLVAASLFAALRERLIKVPEWTRNLPLPLRGTGGGG